MTASVELLARLLDIYDYLPLANRNYMVDPNFDQTLAIPVTLSAGGINNSVSPMYRVYAGASGTGQVFGAAASGLLVSNEQPGMYSPCGGSISFTPGGNSTGTYAGRSAPNICQNIEYVQTLNGRSSTFSLWLWTGSGTATITQVMAAQVFGSGGSPSATVVIDPVVNWVVTTTPKRFSVRIDWPSTAGKTLGTSSNDYIQLGFYLPPTGTTVNVGTRQWQLEQSSPLGPAAGNPTAFEYRGVAAELVRVQRQYEIGSEPVFYNAMGTGGYNAGYDRVGYRTTKRAPAAVTFTNWKYYSVGNNTAFTPGLYISQVDQFSFAGTGLTSNNGWTGDGTWIADSRL